MQMSSVSSAFSIGVGGSYVIEKWRLWSWSVICHVYGPPTSKLPEPAKKRSSGDIMLECEQVDGGRSRKEDKDVTMNAIQLAGYLGNGQCPGNVERGNR
jgi:hypothetical protein